MISPLDICCFEMIMIDNVEEIFPLDICRFEMVRAEKVKLHSKSIRPDSFNYIWGSLHIVWDSIIH